MHGQVGLQAVIMSCYSPSVMVISVDVEDFLALSTENAALRSIYAEQIILNFPTQRVHIPSNLQIPVSYTGVI